jgi:hypothetical protein
MARYPEHIQKLVTTYSLKDDDLWQVQSTWVIKHKAVERIGVQLGICWDAPTIVEGKTDELTVVVIVTGRLGERTEWSFGECSPSNYRVSGRMQAYPWAMAEKRGKDRVILKFLAVYGDVYGEDESEDFKAPDAKPSKRESIGVLYTDDKLYTKERNDPDYTPPGEPDPFPIEPDVARKSAHAIKKERPNDWAEVVSKMRAATTLDALDEFANSEYRKKMTADWPVGFLDQLRDEYRACMSALAVGRIAAE